MISFILRQADAQLSAPAKSRKPPPALEIDQRNSRCWCSNESIAVVELIGFVQERVHVRTFNRYHFFPTHLEVEYSTSNCPLFVVLQTRCPVLVIVMPLHSVAYQLYCRTSLSIKQEVKARSRLVFRSPAALLTFRKIRVWHIGMHLPSNVSRRY